MDADLEALLALQADDDVVDGLVARLEELAPRLAALDAAREAMNKRLQQAQHALEGEEKRKRELEQRLSEHRQKQERNVAQFDVVKRMKEATAAQSQVDTGNKMLQEGESEVKDACDRVDELRRSIDEQRAGIARTEEEQGTARATMAVERKSLESELKDAKSTRDRIAAQVPNGLRSKYERIRSRRNAQSVFALVSGACSACDTALPLQKKNVMVANRQVDVCEACGVLLYATD
ncbi:MAG: hypothetical protein ABIT38_17030 [Gemmatimonadaceae bacterium]